MFSSVESTSGQVSRSIAAVTGPVGRARAGSGSAAVGFSGADGAAAGGTAGGGATADEAAAAGDATDEAGTAGAGAAIFCGTIAPGATAAAAPTGAARAAADVPRGFGREHARNHQLQLESRRCRAGHVVEGAADEVGDSRQTLAAEDSGLAAHPFQFINGNPTQNSGCRGSGCLDHDQVAQALEQIVHEPARVLARLDDTINGTERGGRIGVGERLDDLVEQLGVGVAQQRDRPLVPNGRRARVARDVRPGDQLIEQRQRVSRRAPTARTTRGSTPGSTCTPSWAASSCTYSSMGPGGTSRKG